jgi:hypothetical protein
LKCALSYRSVENDGKSIQWFANDRQIPQRHSQRIVGSRYFRTESRGFQPSLHHFSWL